MFKKSLFITAFLVLLSVIMSTPKLQAAGPLDEICSGSGKTSTACKSNTNENPLVGPKGILTKVVEIIIIITGVASIVVIMIGGFKYMTSTGDPNKTKSAKDTILYAVIGLVIAVMAQGIVSFVLNKL